MSSISPRSTREIIQMQQKAPEMIKGLEHMVLEERRRRGINALYLERIYREKKATLVSEVLPPCKDKKKSPQRKLLLDIRKKMFSQ